MAGSPKTYDPADFARLLAHEMFHEWNPRRLNYSDDQTIYWFTEGFTEYYAVASVWRSGIWELGQVLQHFNRMARSYYGSPMRNLTSSRMVELRQSNVSANQLPCQQGYLLAAHWNSTGRSLDVAMRNLLKDNQEPLSNARIVRALRSIGIEHAEEEIQRFVVEGKTIELRTNLWGTCAEETKTEFRASKSASTGANRKGRRSFTGRSRTAMLGMRGFGTARIGHRLMWLWVTRATWPRSKLGTNRGAAESNTIRPPLTRTWLRNTRPSPTGVILEHSLPRLWRDEVVVERLDVARD
jgi:hypothetical protein